MTKEEMLQQFTLAEPNEEVKRRVQLRKAARIDANKVKRQCRNCKFFGTINIKGQAIAKTPRLFYESYYCPHCKLRRRKPYTEYRMIRGYEYACEHFVLEEEDNEHGEE